MEDEHTQNPYESPNTLASPRIDEGSQVHLGWYFGAAVAATILSAALPFIAVPVAFLLAPAYVRAWRLRRIRISEGETPSGFEFALLVVASFTYAIPSAIASVAAFCCVCFPGAYVGSSIGVQRGRDPNYGFLLIGGVALLIASTFCGLWAGDGLLRRFRYFIKDTED